MSDDSLGQPPTEDESAQGANDQDTSALAKSPDGGNSVGENTRNAEDSADDETVSARLKKARLESALRKYRATLRNEAETGNEGFSADDYKSQKPPHW